MLAPASLSNIFSQPWWQAVGAIVTGMGVLVAAATLIPVSRSVTQASKSFRIGLLENQQQTYRTDRLQEIRQKLEKEEPELFQNYPNPLLAMGSSKQRSGHAARARTT
jgi:hypothetical protein